MGKGGPLAFLNKKTWHPGRVQNLEEVWKREQAAAKEDQRLKDLQKQIAEERAREELHQVAEAGGHKIKSDRIDWMYQGGMMARQEADQRIDAQAATAATAAPDEPQGGRAEALSQLPSFYAEDTPVAANEVWQRLHADPLFAIKQQEQAARKSIIANPVKMQAIKSQVQQLKELAGKAGKKEKKEKKHKKEKKEKKKRKDASSDSEPEHAAKRQRSASPHQFAAPEHARAGRAPEPSCRAEQTQPGRDDWGPQRQQRREQPHHSGGDDYGRRQWDGGRERGLGDRRGDGAGGAGRDRSRDRQFDRGGGRRREERGGGGRREEEDRYGGRRREDEQRHRDERVGGGKREEGGRHRGDERGEGREPRRRARSIERGGGGGDGGRGTGRRERSPEGARARDVPQQQQQQQQQREEEEEEEEGGKEAGPRGVAVHMDGATAQGRGADYGLSRGHLPEAVQRQDRSDFAEQTRKRLEEAARKREAEEREKAAQKYQRREYRTGQLSAEERAARLAEMAAAAEAHEGQRHQRLKAVEEKERAEEEEQAQRHHSDTAAFLQQASKDVYGTTAGGSLEDRVGRRKFYSDRKEGGGGGGFKK